MLDMNCRAVSGARIADNIDSVAGQVSAASASAIQPSSR